MDISYNVSPVTDNELLVADNVSLVPAEGIFVEVQSAFLSRSDHLSIGFASQRYS